MHNHITIIECREIELDMDTAALGTELCEMDVPESRVIAQMDIELANLAAAERKSEVCRRNLKALRDWLAEHDLRENKKHFDVQAVGYARNAVRMEKKNGTAAAATARS